ncbi:DUF3100 domain-containing protein [Acidocella facilis]|uniref:DUF3100 domain-containing protein n=1 Tax=Acidocella facilis TaxID=525 RepID=UPI00047ED9A3|nr:DUF3100 domain-containing protein [Acidocella facilis]
MENTTIYEGTAPPAQGNLVTSWTVHGWALAMTVIAELIGPINVPLGSTKVTLLPLVWGMLLGIFAGIIATRLPQGLGVRRAEQQKASAIIQVAVLIFVADLALLVGAALPKLIQSGWALVFQELGHFLGTIIIALPLALLLGIKREAVGATYSVGREPNLAIIGEKYGMSSPEGRGVLAEYVTGTVVGAVFISVLASLIASTGLFNPLALAMGAGVGSGSMMAAATGGIVAQSPAGMAHDIAAFAAASNLITTTVGTYFTLFISLPLANFIYRTLEPMIGRKAVGQPDARLSVHDAKEIAIGWGTMVGLLAIVAFIALVAGNWITYKTAPQAALLGTVIIVAVAAIGATMARFLPVKIPAVFWATLIGMALTAPYWPGAHAITLLTGKMHFLALATVVLTYAGMSLAKDIKLFKALGWRIVLVSLVANAGTFIFASLIAEVTLPK